MCVQFPHSAGYLLHRHLLGELSVARSGELRQLQNKAVYHCVSLSEVMAPRSNNFECDWLIELSDDKLSYNN